MSEQQAMHGFIPTAGVGGEIVCRARFSAFSPISEQIEKRTR
jgi:hypothetical protein